MSSTDKYLYEGNSVIVHGWDEIVFAYFSEFIFSDDASVCIYSDPLLKTHLTFQYTLKACPLSDPLLKLALILSSPLL
jgi:hypothetical protein